MRVASVAMLRGLSRMKQRLPTEGTRIRFVYDFLYEHRGRAISHEDWEILAELCTSPVRSTNTKKYSCLLHIVSELKNYWGCDIRGHALVGEWCGKAYLDYTLPAERDARDEQMARIEREGEALERRLQARKAA